MKRSAVRCRAWVPVASLVLVLTLPAARAELLVKHNPRKPPSTLVASISEGPDPVDSRLWKRHNLETTDDAVLNAGGDDRQDGRPSMDWNAAGYPSVVWAYNNGTDHDIAFSQWDGKGWTATEFITSGVSDELDPRIFVAEDATIHVIYWVAGSYGRVFRTTRNNTSFGWSNPVEITADREDGRTPTIAVHEGTLWVAYVRPSVDPAFVQEIVAVPLGNTSLENGMVVGRVHHALRLDPILHVTPHEMWIDWKHDGNFLAWSGYLQPGWDTPSRMSWNDTTWIGVEDARARIRMRVHYPIAIDSPSP